MNRTAHISLAACLMASICANVSAQKFSFEQKGQLSYSLQASTNRDVNPLLPYSNKWGEEVVFEQYGTALKGAYQASLRTARRMKFEPAKSLIEITGGAKGVVANEKRRIGFNEGYVNARLGMTSLLVGMREWTPVESNNGLSTGSFLMSDNAKPMPQIMGGIFDWWAVPCTFNFLQLKGGISLSRRGKDGHSDNSYDYLFNQKFAYGRVGGFEHFMPYVGFIHNVGMGGTNCYGQEIPLDFWNSLWGKKGDAAKFGDIYRGEATNAAGAHMGMWDLGFYSNIGNVRLMAYYQRLFTDNATRHLIPQGGYAPYEHNAKDFAIGICLNTALAPFKRIVAEFVNNKYQGGAGMADPHFVDKNGRDIYVFPTDLDNVDLKKWLYDHFEEADIDAYQQQHGAFRYESIAEILTFLRRTNNHDLSYGGRLNYMSNGFYKYAWTQRDLGMGSALMRTGKQVGAFAPLARVGNATFFPITRLRAFTIGMEGDISPAVAYRFRYNVCRNYGNYIDQYGGPFVFNELPDYYFKTAKRQHAIEMQGLYKINQDWTVSGNIGIDVGDMYNSAQVRIEIKYDI